MSRLARLFILSAALAWAVVWNGAALAAPDFQAAGTPTAGTGARTPAWPAHAVDDIALLFVETRGEQTATLSTAAGFVEVANSPQNTGTGSTGTRLTVFWARATSTSMSSPTIADAGDHVVAQILTYRGVFNAGDPWDVTGGGVNATADTAISATGVTTTVPDTLVVVAFAQGRNASSTSTFSNWTNANLTGVTERADYANTSGDGGGFGVMDGVKATAGATGTTTGEIGNSFVTAFLTIALKPSPPPPTVIAISPNSGPTAGGTSVTITGTNFTGATAVTIGGAAATGITVVNATTITATTPAGTPGAQDVVVTTPGGSGTGTGLFTYEALPIAEYRFEESSAGTVIDSSGNSLSGALNGGVTVGGSGKVCNGYNFNGTNAYVSVPNTALLNQPNITAMAWVRHSAAAFKSWEAILAKGDTAYRLHLNGGCSINAPRTDDGLSFGINGGCSTADADSNVVPVAGTWYHVAGTYDGATIKIYVDGVLKVSAAYAGAINSNTFPLWIGNNSQQTGRYWSGDIDEVKIYNVALSAAQIAAGYANENAGNNWDGTARSCGSVHHYELSLPTSSITCLPTTATVTACTDNSSPCTSSSTTLNGQTATLAASAGALGATTVVFNASGIASTTLSYPAAADGATASVTLSNEQTATANPRQCCQNGICVVANSCSTTFNTAGFVFSGSAGGAVATIPTQVAGTTSGTYYLRAVKTNTTTKACESALSGQNTVNFAYECNNPTSCYGANLMSVNGSVAGDGGWGTSTAIARNNNSSVSSYLPVNMTFDANGNAPLTFNYGDVGLVKLYASKAASGSLLSALSGSSNSFVVKPYGFTVTGIKRTSDSLANPAAADATGTKFVKAGEAFTATVTAIANGGAATPNYGKESSPEGVKLTSTLSSGLGLSNNPALSNGTIAGGSFTDGVATPTNLDWTEVGIITLTPSVGDGDYLGAGDVTGTTTGNVGRFYPDHFALSSGSITTRTDISPACSPASAFSYMDEPFQAGFTLTAQGPSPGNVTLLNYVSSGTPANNFAKLATGTPIPAGFGLAYLDGATDLTARVDSSLGITGTWTGGVLAATATLGFTRNAAPDGPYDAMKAGIAPADSDGVALSAFDMDVTAPAGNDHAQVGQTQIRFGRLRLSNAHGSELLDLPISMEAQYWNGTLFATNTLDNCTTITPGNIALANFQGNLTACETAVSLSGPLAAGKANLKMLKPGVNNNGSVDLTVNLGGGALGSTCLAQGGATSADVPANLSYLQGRWSGATYDQNPSGRATFGVYKNANEFIYLREMY